MCVHHLYTSLPLMPLFLCFVFEPHLLCFLGLSKKKKTRGGGRENEHIACVQKDITLLKAKQICVCASPVILLLTCALTVGIWDPGNDWGRYHWRQVEDGAV